MLQIFFKNNKKEKNTKISDKKSSIPQTPKSNKFNSSFNFNFQKYESEKNTKEEKNVTPIKKIKNNKYIFNNKNKFNNSHLYESRNLNQNNDNRNTISISLNNNLLFPSVNGKTSLFKLTKKGTKLDNNLDDKIKQNDYAYNNINLQNFNSNSILITETRPKKFSFFQKYLSNKISFQKNVNYKNVNSLKIFNSEESVLKKMNNIRFNTEISDKIISEKTNKNNISSNFNYNYINEKNEINFNKKINKAKSFKFNNLRNINYYNNKPILTENYPEIKKKKNVLSFIPRNNNKDLKLSIIQAFIHDKSRDSSNNKNKKIFFMKNKNKDVDENNKILNHNIKPIKAIQIINNDNLKTINYINNKDINKNQNKFFISKTNKINDKNYSSNSNINNGSDNSDNKSKKKIFPRKKSYYSNKENNIKYIFKNEEKYITNKKLKIIEKSKQKNKFDDTYISSNKELFLRNYVIENINKNILENDLLLKLKEEEKKEKLIKMQKYLVEIFHYIINKSNDYNSYENIDKLGLYFFSEEPIDPKIKIHNNLGFFDMYREYIKHFEDRWKNNNEINYKQLIEFYSFNNILNDKKNKNSFFEIEDRKLFSYKERISKDFNFNFETINFIKTNEAKKDNKTKKNQKYIKEIAKTKYQMRKLKRILYQRSKTLSLSIPRNSKSENIKSVNDNNSFIEAKKEEKMASFSKIQKELMPGRRINSVKKNTNIKRILPRKTKKKINITKIINNNKENKIEKKEKEIAFDDVSKKVENYNILKNIELFKNNINKQNDLDKEEKLKKELSKRLTIKYIEEFPEDISIINRKAIEIEEELPDTKLFRELVDILNKKEIDKFYYLVQNNENDFNKIINKQEYSTGNTLLIYATKNNLKSIVEFLLIKGANTEIKNILGRTALQIAYQNDNTFIINLFEEYNKSKK